MDDTQNVVLTREEEHNERPAGFWMRFWAYTVDIIIVWSVNGILFSPLKFVNDGASVDIGFWTLAGIMSTIILYLYFVLMTKLYGQTVGQMLFGLHVIRNDSASLKCSDLPFT